MSVQLKETVTCTLAAFFFTSVLAVPAYVIGSSAAVTETTLGSQDYETYGKALAEQVIAGDGAGSDSTFRNSGIAIDPDSNAYFAVNGVHPVRRGDYSSYYPKSIVKASLADDSIIKVYSFSQVNGRDVDPFVHVVVSRQFDVAADMNWDGAVNGLDVTPFVAAVLSGGGVTVVPEPSTAVLVTTVLLGLLCWRRTR